MNANAVAPASHQESPRPDLLLLAAVLLVAVVGRLPALGAWWTLDDWGLLARAAGLEAGPGGLPARWLSQHLWWRLTWPLLGLDADAHAVTRLALHGLASVLVLRLGGRLGLGRGGRLVAGLLHAASPLVFTVLYWAAGVQELLAAAAALAAVDLWLDPRRGRRALAALAVLVSLGAKESGLGLPLLLGVLGVARARGRRLDPLSGIVLIFLALAATVEAVLVLRHFATGAGDPYSLGGLSVVLRNVGVFGWWMVTPGPVYAASVEGATAVVGALPFAAWAVWSGLAWRRGDRRPAVLLLACLLALAPVLPLRVQLKPYLATLPMAPAVLAVGLLVPRRWSPRPVLVLALAALATVAAFGGMRARLGARNDLGFPADPLVRATALSWQSSRLLRNLRWPPDADGPRRLVLLQVPVAPEARREAEGMGERWVRESELHRALGGSRGPRLLLDPDVQVTWANALTAAPSDALVLCESGEGFHVWGTLPQACLYAALTDVGLGAFGRARLHLLRAAGENPETVSFAWDEGAMIVPLQMVLDNKEAFVDWTVRRLAAGEASRMEVGGLQDLFLNLLESATGRSRAELTAGGRWLSGPAATDTVTFEP